MDVLSLLILVTIVIYFILRDKGGRLQEISTDHLPDSFIVLDLETTGLDANRHEIIEIAAIRYQKGTDTHKTFQSLVKPTRKVPKKITELTGITQEMLVESGHALPNTLVDFASFIGQLRLVTFNAEFDMAFLHTANAKHGLPALLNPVSCALKMARRAWPRRKSFRLIDLASDGKFADGRAHRALEDARRALLVYAAAVAKLKSVE